MRVVRLLLVAVFGVAGLNLAACSSGDGNTRTVAVDYNFDDFVGSFLGYFPRNVTVKPGMTLKFHQTWTGAPHSVTFVKAPADVNAQFLAQFPRFFNGGRIAQDAAQPCFAKTLADLPLDHSACSKADQVQPEFTGRYAYYSSGLIRSEGPSANNFEMKIANDATPGAYFYYCNLHGLTMSGFVTVSKSAKVATQRALNRVGRNEAQTIAAPLLAEYRKEKNGTSIHKGNLAGSGDPSTQGIAAEINEFTPRQITTVVGDKVTWTFVGNHSISFNVPTFTPLFTKTNAGEIVVTEGLDKPAGGWPGAPAGHKAYPALTDATVALDAGNFNGTHAFTSSGIGFNTGDTYAVTFTKKGTYPYACVIHPGMIGKVVVT